MAIIKPKKNGYGGHIVFQNDGKNYDRHALAGINLLCKLAEFIFIYEVGVKHFVKLDEGMHRQADRGRACYNLQSSRIYKLYRLEEKG